MIFVINSLSELVCETRLSYLSYQLSNEDYQRQIGTIPRAPKLSFATLLLLLSWASFPYLHLILMTVRWTMRFQGPKTIANLCASLKSQDFITLLQPPRLLIHPFLLHSTASMFKVFCRVFALISPSNLSLDLMMRRWIVWPRSKYMVAVLSIPFPLFLPVSPTVRSRICFDRHFPLELPDNGTGPPTRPQSSCVYLP